MKTKEEYNEYMRKYMLERYHQRRAYGVEFLGGSCVVCGSKSNLEFDHIVSTDKSFSLAKKLHTISKKGFLKELEKCQLLCSSCHSDKSIADCGNKKAKGTHGTLSSYLYCRCDLCRGAKSDYMKEWRKKRKAAANDPV